MEDESVALQSASDPPMQNPTAPIFAQLTFELPAKYLAVAFVGNHLTHL